MKEGDLSHLCRLDLEGKVLMLLPKAGKKEAPGLASPVVSLDLLDILPHPDAACVERQLCCRRGWRLWLRRQQSR